MVRKTNVIRTILGVYITPVQLETRFKVQITWNWYKKGLWALNGL